MILKIPIPSIPSPKNLESQSSNDFVCEGFEENKKLDNLFNE